MDEQTQLKDSILAQAHEKGRKLLEEAKESVLKEEAVQEERLIQDKLNQRSEQLKRIQRQLQRETQQIENKKRQSTLVTKQRVLKDLFADAYEAMAAWPLEKEVQFVDAVLDRCQGQDVTLTFGATSAAKFDPVALEKWKQTHPNVTVADETIPAQAGFVLSVGKIDDNYLYRDLVDSIWEQESYQMAASIFTDEEN
jgi:V/A-type H+-transporting ATPase subunit E